MVSFLWWQLSRDIVGGVLWSWKVISLQHLNADKSLMHVFAVSDGSICVLLEKETTFLLVGNIKCNQNLSIRIWQHGFTLLNFSMKHTSCLVC